MQASFNIEPMMNEIFSQVQQNMQANCRPAAGCNQWTTSNCAVDKTTWTMNVNLRKYPTKPEDLNVKEENGNLILSGKSETQNEHNGFKVILQFLTHERIHVVNSTHGLLYFKYNPIINFKMKNPL